MKFLAKPTALSVITYDIIYVITPPVNIVYILDNFRLIVLNNVKPNGIPLRTMTIMLHIAYFSS